MGAVDRLLSRVGVVLTWEDIHGAPSRLDDVRADVRVMHPYTVLAYACHWNAMISPLDGTFEPDIHASIVQQLIPRPEFARIADAIHELPRDGILNRHQLLLLIRLVLEETDWTAPIPDDGRVDGRSLFDVLLKLNDHLAQPSPSERTKRASSFGSLFAMHDLFHRRYALGSVGRTLSMLGEIDTHLRSRSRTWPDIHAFFEQGAALSVARFHELTFATCVVARPRAGLSPSPPDSTAFGEAAIQGHGGATPEELRAFLSALSLRPDELRQRLLRPEERPATLNFSTFRDRPLVQVADGIYRVIDPEFLLNKLGDGVFWYLHRGAQNESKVNELRGWWGGLFEEYTHRLMQHYFPPQGGRYIPRPRFDGNGDEAVDAMLALPNSLVLFEFKGSLVKKDARHSGHSRRLAHDVRKKFASIRSDRQRATGVTQLARAIRQLLAPASQGSGRLGPVKRERARRIYPVLVCLDTGMGSPLMNCYLHRQMCRALGPVDAHRVRPLTLLTIEDLERVLPYTEEHSFAEILDKWHACDPDMLTSFGYVMEDELYSSARKDNTWIQSKWKEWSDHVIHFFFPG
jgi:hypothetical protein